MFVLDSAVAVHDPSNQLFFRREERLSFFASLLSKGPFSFNDKESCLNPSSEPLHLEFVSDLVILIKEF